MGRTPRIAAGPAAIAFDLDGTLVDSAPDIAHALNEALGHAGLPALDLDTVRGWIGDGPDALIGRALEAHGCAGDHDLPQRLRERFDRATLAAPLGRGVVFAGIEPVLHSLSRRLPLVVVTNKPTSLARAVLAAARLLPLICEVYGADTPAHRKPSPLLLQAAARRLGVPPHRLLMVGDGRADLQAARAAGCNAALVAWGYGSDQVAADAPAWRVRTPQHLLGAVLLGRSVGTAAANE